MSSAVVADAAGVVVEDIAEVAAGTAEAAVIAALVLSIWEDCEENCEEDCTLANSERKSLFSLDLLLHNSHYSRNHHKIRRKYKRR